MHLKNERQGQYKHHKNEEKENERGKNNKKKIVSKYLQDKNSQCGQGSNACFTYFLSKQSPHCGPGIFPSQEQLQWSYQTLPELLDVSFVLMQYGLPLKMLGKKEKERENNQNK